jgi:hypothetical protein
MQYRAGDEESYHEIVENTLQHMVWMYGNHSTWHYTIECQFMLLNFTKTYYPNIFEAIRYQNQQGQLELIVQQYSDSFQVPYPSKDFRESLNYTKQAMKENGLNQSKLMLLQEGQWLPAFGLATSINPTIKTAVISLEQCGYFNYFPEKPILEWELFGMKMNAFVIPWVPIYQGGVYWHMIYTQDGEKLNTGGASINVGVANEFSYNPDKQDNLEKRHIELEKKGNEFLTLEEFYDYLYTGNQIGKMEKYIPETEWVAAQYKQYFTWMGDGSGSSDDGYMLARFYYARNLIQATEVLIEKAYSTSFLTLFQYKKYSTQLLEAKTYQWEATVTDTTGISPREVETQYGLNKSRDAMDICWKIINQIKSLPGSPYSSAFQVVPYNNSIITNPTDFIHLQKIADSNISEIESLFKVQMEIEQNFDTLFPTKNRTEIQEISLNGKKYTLYSLKLDFEGKYNITLTHDSIITINETFLNTNNRTSKELGSNEISVRFKGNWTNITYSPALAENNLQELQRDEYFTHPFDSSKEWWFLLSLCNGLLYNPQEQFAIIKNTTQYHLAAKWNPDSIEFLTDDVKYHSTQEYFFVKANVDESLALANFMNTYQPFIL